MKDKTGNKYILELRTIKHDHKYPSLKSKKANNDTCVPCCAMKEMKYLLIQNI